MNNQLKPRQRLQWPHNCLSSNSSCSFCGFQESLTHCRILERGVMAEEWLQARFGIQPSPLQLVMGEIELL